MHASIENSKRVMSVVDKVQAEFEEAQAREGEAHDSLQRYLAYRDIAAVVIAGRIYQRDDIDINDPWLTSPVVVLPD
jgi:predicted dehydrogenase